MSKRVVVTTKDNLKTVIHNDEKEIIIQGELAERVQKSQKFRKFGMILLFLISFSLLLIPCVKLVLFSETQAIFTLQDNDVDDQISQTLQTPSDNSNRRQYRLTSAAEDDKTPNAVNPIGVITEFTKKEIISINLGLGLLVILSICSLLNKIISKYDEILFKVDGKVEVHLVHK